MAAAPHAVGPWLCALRLSPGLPFSDAILFVRLMTKPVETSTRESGVITVKITQRGPGAWRLWWELPRGLDGRRRQKTEVFRGPKKAAEARWREVQREIDQQQVVPTGRMTVAQLAEMWLRDVLPRTVRPSTLASYRMQLETHILPKVGGIQVSRLSVLQVQAMLAEIASPDEDGRVLSPRSQQYVLQVLQRLLRQAVRWQVVPRNVASSVSPPRVPPPRVPSWTQDEARAFLRAAEGHRLYALFALALGTGMRLGEIIGLQWGSVTPGGIIVRRSITAIRGHGVVTEPKTARGRRTITIGSALAAILDEHRQRQAAEAAGLWPGWNADGLVFPSEAGTPLGARNVLRLLHTLQERAGVPAIPFHGLRHTHATQLLASGVQPHVVSKRLGHASVAFTLQVYADVLPTQADEAAEMADRMLGDTRGDTGPQRDTP